MKNSFRTLFAFLSICLLLQNSTLNAQDPAKREISNLSWKEATVVGVENTVGHVIGHTIVIVPMIYGLSFLFSVQQQPYSEVFKHAAALGAFTMLSSRYKKQLCSKLFTTEKRLDRFTSLAAMTVTGFNKKNYISKGLNAALIWGLGYVSDKNNL